MFLSQENHSAEDVAIIGRCSYCGIEVGTYRHVGKIKTLKVAPLSDNLRLAAMDHVIPRCKGGTNIKENLLLSCFNCNSSKGRKTLEEFRKHFYYSRLGITKFTDGQRAFLLDHGFPQHILDGWKLFVFHFEEEQFI